MDEDEPEPMSLEQLQGARLVWTDKDGTKQVVEFDD